MKKTGILATAILAIFLLLGVGGSIFANGTEVGTSAVTINEQFKDPEMAQAVANMYAGGDIGAEIDSVMINNATNFTINLDTTITDLTGIDIFVNLQVIYLKGTELESLPDNIDSLINLKSLYIGSSQITTLPDSIGNLGSGFQRLGITNSPLTSLPDSIGNLSGLDTLEIDSTKVTKLPDSVTNLSSLLMLAASDANIIDLPQSHFNFITSLDSYNLNGQSYEEVLAVGYMNKEYSFKALPVYEQFPSYGVDFTFNLTKPDSSVVNITPQIIDGKIVIDGSYLDQEGEYNLTSEGMASGGRPISSYYTHIFAIGVSTPVIDLMGDNPIVINEGSVYAELGATASDEVDGDLTSDILITGVVNTMIPGKYIVTYAVTNSYGVTSSAEREVIVKSIPVIKLIGDNPLTIEEGTTYEEPGYMAKDTKDGDLTSKVVVTGEVDVNKPGKYILTYTVTNSDGNSVSVDREVIVKEKVVVPDTVNKIPKTGGMVSLLIGVTGLLGGSVLVFKGRKNK